MGATFVVLTENDEELVKLNQETDSAVSPPSEILNLKNAARIEWQESITASTFLSYPLAHLLSQHDGAAILDHEGFVRYVGAWLIAGDIDVDGPLVVGHSASHGVGVLRKQIDGFVVVTSSDGPVTVYRKGRTA